MLVEAVFEPWNCKVPTKGLSDKSFASAELNKYLIVFTTMYFEVRNTQAGK